MIGKRDRCFRQQLVPLSTCKCLHVLCTYEWELPIARANIGPGTFEQHMETVLKGMQCECVVLYLDDIIIFLKDVDSHLKRIEKVMGCLATANLRLKPCKCHFFSKQVEFLGQHSRQISNGYRFHEGPYNVTS